MTLRRSGPPERRTPLDSKSELQRKTPMPRTPAPKLSGTGLSRKGRAPQRKPMRQSRPIVSREEVESRRIVRQRSDGLCEIGWVCAGDVWATDYVHRKARSQGGPFDAANAGDGCRPCHQRCHSEPEQARQRGWMVRRSHDFRAIPVDHARHGHVLLASDGSWTPTTREAA